MFHVTLYIKLFTHEKIYIQGIIDIWKYCSLLIPITGSDDSPI